MNQSKKILIIKNIFIIILLCFISLTLAQDKKRAAPAFRTRDLKGKIVTSEKLYEKGPCLVFFWHSCCGLNKDQLKVLKDFYTKYKEEGLEIVGIALDGVSKTAKVKKAVNVYKMPWVSVVDKNNQVKDKFNPTFVPTVFIVSKGGKIYSTYSGYETGDDKKQQKDLESLFGGTKEKSSE